MQCAHLRLGFPFVTDPFTEGQIVPATMGGGAGTGKMYKQEEHREQEQG